MRRTLIGFLVAANLAIFGGLAVVWLAANEVAGSVPTIDAADLDLTEEPPELGEPRTFLLVGSDSREGLPEDFPNVGNFGGSRADVMILVTVFPGESRVQMLSLPRDLRIERNGTAMRINATLNEGASSVLDAVSNFAQVPIHHYIQIDFAGFAEMVDAVGGIRMTFLYPTRDTKSGLDIKTPGTKLLDGQEALAFARSRRYQEFRNGSWVSVDGGDIGRTGRQQDLLLALLTQLERPSSLDGFGELVDALGGFVATDNALDADDIVQVGWEMRSLQAESVETRTLPVNNFTDGGVAYVIPIEPDATNLLAAFRNGETITEALAPPRVEVQNGNGRAGAASDMGAALRSGGYDVVAEGNSLRSDFGTTIIVADPAYLAEARQIAELLGYGRVETGQPPDGSDIVVIVGADAPAS